MLPQISNAQATFIFSMQNCRPLDQIVSFVLFAAMPKEVSPKFVQFLNHFCRYSEVSSFYKLMLTAMQVKERFSFFTFSFHSEDISFMFNRYVAQNTTVYVGLVPIP